MQLPDGLKNPRVLMLAGGGVVLLLILWLLLPSNKQVEVGEPALKSLEQARKSGDVQTLANAAKDADARRAAYAVQSMGYVGGTQVRQPIQLSLADPRADVRLAGISAFAAVIGRKDATAIPVLQQAMHRDPDPVVRAKAVAAMGGMRVYEALPGLIVSLADPDRNVRQSAKITLEKSLALKINEWYNPDDPPQKAGSTQAKLTEFINRPSVRARLIQYWNEQESAGS